MCRKFFVKNCFGEDIDVTGDEAIMKDGKCIGYITSGGYAHHVKKSLAMGYIPNELATKGSVLDVEINGNFYKSYIQTEPLYDPRGTKMRS